MYGDIEHLLRQLMKRFVKKSLIKEADCCKACEDNWCSYKEVDVGVAALATVSV